MSPKIIETGRDAQASPAEDPGVDRGRQAETEARDEIKKVSLETNVETVDLPSGYAFYDVDGIGVRNFKFREYALLATAQEAGSFRSLAEAVANTVIGMDAMKMTYGDFQYVMYLHRLRMKRRSRLNGSATPRNTSRGSPPASIPKVRSSRRRGFRRPTWRRTVRTRRRSPPCCPGASWNRD